MKRTGYTKYRKAQSFLEYALLITVVVGGLLGIQSYLKRSMQGQYQLAGDQMANQYAFGLTEAHEHFESEMRTTEWKLPGPADVIRVRGSFETNSDRSVVPLGTNLYHSQNR